MALVETCWPERGFGNHTPTSFSPSLPGDAGSHRAPALGQHLLMLHPKSSSGQPGALVFPLWGAGSSHLSPPLPCLRASSSPSS